MPTYLQGLTIGLAYVAPIGMQTCSSSTPP